MRGHVVSTKSPLIYLSFRSLTGDEEDELAWAHFHSARVWCVVVMPNCFPILVLNSSDSFSPPCCLLLKLLSFGHLNATGPNINASPHTRCCSEIPHPVAERKTSSFCAVRNRQHGCLSWFLTVQVASEHRRSRLRVLLFTLLTNVWPSAHTWVIFL